MAPASNRSFFPQRSSDTTTCRTSIKPLEVETVSLHNDLDDTFGNEQEQQVSPVHINAPWEETHDDVISECIREGTQGVALFAVVAVSTCMAIISFLLILQYQPLPTADDDADVAADETNPNEEQGVCATNTNEPPPSWTLLMHQQIQVIQNLVHASLLGGAAFVAAFRGDAVWLFFSRNCCFFFGLSALSYLAVDLFKMAERHRSGLGITTTTSFVASILLSISCAVAFVPLELTRQRVSRHVQKYARGHEANYPKWLPSTRSQLLHSTIILRMADCIQVAAIVYTIMTTAVAIADCDSKTSIAFLESSYREGAHQAFLLALLFLAATSPGEGSRVGGAILCSGWRLLLGLSYLSFPLSHPLATFTASEVRETASLAATIVEIGLVLPILISALLLQRENLRSTLWKNANSVEYSRIGPDDRDVGDDEDGGESDDELDDVTPDYNHRIASLSMFQIYKSSAFSNRQRLGSFILWFSSALLLVGMTLECVLLIVFVQDNAEALEIYQWGMHVAAMYLFCTHMCLGSKEVYARARYLLAITCPTGSVIAAWQIWQLSSDMSAIYNDRASLAAAILFSCRCACGIGQCLGLVLLQTVEPTREVMLDLNPPHGLDHLLKRARFALYRLYIPAVVVNVAATGFFSSSSRCSGEPLISPTTPACLGDGQFALAKHWPGMGVFFHFGGLLVIFANDAMQRGSYPPALAVSIFFSANVTLLLAADLMLLLVEKDWSGMNMQFYLKLVWMLAVGYLWFSLQSLWRLRIAVWE